MGASSLAAPRAAEIERAFRAAEVSRGALMITPAVLEVIATRR